MQFFSIWVLIFSAVPSIGQDFWEIHVSPCLNFKGTSLENSRGNTKTNYILHVIWSTVSCHSFLKFLFFFYLILSSMSMVS